MAGAQTRALNSRSTHHPEIRTSGVAGSRPAADLPNHSATELPGRPLTAYELIQMARAARGAQPQGARELCS